MAPTGGLQLDRANSHALSTVSARFTLHLHPSKTQDVMEGVREQLDMGLLRYSEDLGGVMLAYSGEAVASDAPRLHPYFPFLAVTVTARVTLFRPCPGQALVGRVIKVGADYIGLLVLGVFNASIGAARIRREFKCAPQSGTWVSLRDAAHRIAVGGYVRFTVDSVLDHGSLFSIAGSLQEPGTGLEGHASVVAAAAAAGGKQQQANGHAAEEGQRRKHKDRHKDKEKDREGKKHDKKHKDKDKDKSGKDKKRRHSAPARAPASAPFSPPPPAAVLDTDPGPAVMPA